MRALLIFLSIGLIFTLIQYSNGAPIDSISSESDEDDRISEEQTISLKPVIDNSDESDETTTQRDESSESDETSTQPKLTEVQVKENNGMYRIDEALELSKDLEGPRTHGIDQDDDSHDDDDEDDDDVARIVDDSNDD